LARETERERRPRRVGDEHERCDQRLGGSRCRGSTCGVMVWPLSRYSCDGSYLPTSAVGLRRPTLGLRPQPSSASKYRPRRDRRQEGQSQHMSVRVAEGAPCVRLLCWGQGRCRCARFHRIDRRGRSAGLAGVQGGLTAAGHRAPRRRGHRAHRCHRVGRFSGTARRSERLTWRLVGDRRQFLKGTVAIAAGARWRAWPTPADAAAVLAAAVLNGSGPPRKRVGVVGDFLSTGMLTRSTAEKLSRLGGADESHRTTGDSVVEALVRRGHPGRRAARSAGYSVLHGLDRPLPRFGEDNDFYIDTREYTALRPEVRRVWGSPLAVCVPSSVITSTYSAQPVVLTAPDTASVPLTIHAPGSGGVPNAGRFGDKRLWFRPEIAQIEDFSAANYGAIDLSTFFTRAPGTGCS